MQGSLNAVHYIDTISADLTAFQEEIQDEIRKNIRA
jgi:hypothetical protein